MSSKRHDYEELRESIADAFDDGRRRVMSGEDDAFASAISIAEESHGALRAVIGLMIDRDAEPGNGAKIEGIRRNDLAQLLCLVNRRIGEAVSQARDTKGERKEAQREERAARARRKSGRASMRVVGRVGDAPERGA